MKKSLHTTFISAQAGVAALILVLLFARTAAASNSSPVLSYEMSVTNNNIVTAAFKPYDQYGDTFSRLDITAGRRLQLSASDRLRVTVNAAVENHREYTGLNHVSLGLDAHWSRKFGIGPHAWVLSTGGSATREEFNDSDRDGTLFRGDVSVSRLIGYNYFFTASFNMESRTSPGVVYNGNRYTTGVRLARRLPRQFWLSAGYALMRGDIDWHCTGTALPPWPSAAEDTFNQFVYRRDSKTKMLSFTLSRTFKNNTTAYITVKRHDTVWAWKSYPNDIVTAGFMKRIH